LSRKSKRCSERWLVISTRPLKRYCVSRGEYGVNVASDRYAPAGVRLIRTSDVTEDGILRSENGAVFIDEADADGLFLEPGDLLFSRSGTLGRALLYTRSATPATFAGYLVRFRARRDVEPRFLYYVSRSSAFLRQIEADAIESTIGNFNAEKYGNLRVPELTLDEQCRIVAFLDTETARIDALIERRRRMIELLEERRLAVTVGAIENRECSRVKLTLLARLGSGHTPSRDRPEWWTNPTIPWITTGDVAQMRGDRIEFIEETRNAISQLGLKNSAAELHPAGTVVLSRTASVGFSAIMARPMATSQDFATWTCGPLLRPRFVLLCLRAMRSELLGRLAMGSTHKTIYMPEIEAIRVPLPTLAEQDRLVEETWERLRPIDAAVDAIERQVDLLREHRQALITAAVTGELDMAKAAA
jgi:type I restriction enzyme, S subunit